jgi:hypothetical protein
MFQKNRSNKMVTIILAIIAVIGIVLMVKAVLVDPYTGT